MPEPDPEPLLRHAPATVHGRYLVRPARSRGAAPWLVGFHGYAQSADVMLEPFVRAAGSDRWLVASVQALHPFYVARTNEVVANWMTRQDRELAIPDNVAYVDTVLDQLEREFGAPSALVFAGFSQGVAMAYRAALLGRRSATALVAAGGDVAPDVLDAARTWPPVFLATGRDDTWYTPARLEAEAAKLRERGAHVRTLVFEGGHEWGEAVAEAVAGLLKGIA